MWILIKQIFWLLVLVSSTFITINRKKHVVVSIEWNVSNICLLYILIYQINLNCLRIFIDITNTLSISEKWVHNILYLDLNIKICQQTRNHVTNFKDGVWIHMTFVDVSSLRTKHEYIITRLRPKNSTNHELSPETMQRKRRISFFGIGSK